MQRSFFVCGGLLTLSALSKGQAGICKNSSKSVVAYKVLVGFGSMKPPIQRTPEELAWEILAYLQRVPDAMDTIEGIACWWLMEQRVIQTMGAVQKALELLVARDLVEVIKTHDGRILYRLNSKNKSERLRLLNGRAPTGKKGSKK